MVSPLAATFTRAAQGEATPRDAQLVADVLRRSKAGAIDRADLVEGAARIYAFALRDAIQAGSPERDTLQAFLDLLGAGRLQDTAQLLLADPGAHASVVRVAQETLRMAWRPAAGDGTFAPPSPAGK